MDVNHIYFTVSTFIDTVVNMCGCKSYLLHGEYVVWIAAEFFYSYYLIVSMYHDELFKGAPLYMQLDVLHMYQMSQVRQ